MHKMIYYLIYDNKIILKQSYSFNVINFLIFTDFPRIFFEFILMKNIKNVVAYVAHMHSCHRVAMWACAMWHMCGAHEARD